jgi:hypothetical protein
MGVFALGTTPGLLGIGGLASVVRGRVARVFFAFSGLLVIGFAIYNSVGGLRLFNWQRVSSPAPTTQTSSAVTTPEIPRSQVPGAPKPKTGVSLENGAQVVRMLETNRGYIPAHFILQKDIPVRWEIDAQAPYTCGSSLVVPSLHIEKTLVKGLNVIEFTPTTLGSIPFSCSMGMYNGAFDVVPKK